jgi:PAS domain S-box-containing protein
VNQQVLAPATEIQRFVFRYGGAVLAVAVGVGMRWLLHDLFGERVPYVTFYVPVALSAMLAGGGPGVVATLLSAAVVDVWIVAADGIHTTSEIVGQGLFVSSCLVTSAMGEMLRRAWRREKAGLEEQVAARTSELQQANATLQTEIEERRQVQETLRESEERFRKVFENAATGIAITDWEARFDRCNPAYTALIGYSEPELRRIDFASLVHPEDREANLAEIHRLQAGDVPYFEIENRYVHKSGRPVWVRKWVSILPDKAGKPAYLMALVTDVTERRRTREALLESEERLRLFIKHAPAALAMFDRQMRYLAVSRRWMTDYGLGDGDIIGRCHYDIFPEFAEPWRAAHRRALAGEIVHADEDRFVRADGSTQWLRWEVRPWHTAAGAVGGIVIFTEDVTPRKRAEESLRESEQRLRLMADALPVLIAYIDADGRYQFNNAGYEKWFGLSRDECKGRHMRDVLGEAAYDAIKEHAEAALAGQHRTFEAIVPYQTAGTRGVLVNYIPHRNAAGKVLGFYALIIDLSERRAAEEAVRNQEARLRAILNTAIDAIITIDRLGIIQSVNPGTVRMFGYEDAEMIGQNIKMLMPSPYRDEHDEYLARFVKTGERHIIGVGREVMALRKDGSVFPVDLAVSEIGELNLFAGIVRDISRRKELEREVVETVSLEQRRIGQDLHDSVGQELTALNLRADELAEIVRGDPADALKLLEQITRGLHRCRQELRSVLRGLLPVAVDSEGLMAALADLVHRTEQEGKVTCTFDCPEPVYVSDNLTATHLFLIAKEAVHNALKHARPREIHVSLYEADGGLILKVQDDGGGMPARLSESLGLGVRIMRNRAAILGGAVTIEPAQPRGTVVTCSIVKSKRK